MVGKGRERAALLLLLLALAGCATGPARAPETGQLTHELQHWEEPSVPDPSEEEPEVWLFDTVASVTPERRESVLEMARLNGDTVGWLTVPGTDIDHVIVQNPLEENNNYYLNINFEGQRDKNGVFCADRRASFGDGRPDNLSRNTALYGHSWDDDPDGELFAQLKRYRDPMFAREHPYIFFSTAAGDMAWEVFAVFDTTVDLPYILPDLSDPLFFDMLDLVYASTLYQYDSAVGPADKVLTLSTCTFSVPGHASLPAINRYRFVVMAKLVQPDEPLRAEAVFLPNREPLEPDMVAVLLGEDAIRRYTYETVIAH